MAGVVAVVALSFVLPGLFRSKTPSAAPAGVAAGAGLPAGTPVPTFSGVDLLSGRAVTAASIYDRKTLLFFSEGVTCQACLEQVQGIQSVGSEMARRGIQLVSITPDPPNLLREAASAYQITTPIISDTSLAMSRAFNTLGQGMHSDTPGHAFVLVYQGKVLWYRDYWITGGTMYVPAAQLLADMPSA